MPGFLRRKTSPSKTVDTETPGKKSSSSDAPPSLPPLFPSRTSHTSSSRKEPESEIAPVPSPSQPGPLQENGTAGDSALLPDITPLHSSLDVDADWQDLLRFIDSPSLLADSSEETKRPTTPEKRKQNSTSGVALVTSNRYLSNAQKTRMTQERGLKLSDTAEPPRRVSPHGDKPKREESENVSKPNATSGLSVLCNGLSANNANPLLHRISSILEDQQDTTTNENGRVTTANVSTHTEHETNKRREGAQGPQALAAQPKFEASALAKDAKPTRKDSKTSGNGNGSFFSKVIDIREGRSGRSSAVRRSDLPNGTQIADGSTVRPTADVTNGKQATIDTPSNGKQATDTSNKKPVIDVADWLASVKRVAKDGEVLGRTTRVASVIERSRSPLARSRSPQEPPAPQKSLSQSPPPTSRSPPPSSRSSRPNSAHKHSSAVQNTVAMPSVMTTTTAVMTNEKMKTKTRENAPAAKNEQAGKATNGMMISIRGRKTTQSVTRDGGKTAVPSPRDEELRTAGHLEQPQHHQRITQGQAHNNQVQAQQRSSNGHPPSHTHRRTASSESQGNKTHLNGYHSPAIASAQVNGNANVHLTPAPHFSAAPNSVPSPYPTPGFYPTTGYLPTSFCPSAYPNSFTPSFNANPYNAAYGGMYNPFTPFQHFGLGSAFPSQFPSPSTNLMLDPNSNGRIPQLHKAPSTASFFDAVMSGVSGIAGSQGLSGTPQQNPVQRTTTRSMSGESTTSRDKDKPRVLTKVRPTPPPTPPHVAGSAHAGAHAAGGGRTGRRRSGYDEDDRVREVCALLDSDPFAKAEGVRVVTRDGRSGSVSCHGHGSLSGHGHGSTSDHGHGSVSGHGHGSIAGHGRDTPARPLYFPSLDGRPNSSHARASKGLSVRDSHLSESKEGGNDVLEEVEEEVPKTYFPLAAFLSNADFFARMLEYLEFRDWLALYAVGRGAVRSLFDSVAPCGPSGGKGKTVQCNARQFREIVLERFLRPVGYAKWGYEWAEPIVLTLRVCFD
ncbi:hypothetical protein EDD17DRAFT_1521698, partial [Pisolithus thermaeus]